MKQRTAKLPGDTRGAGWRMSAWFVFHDRRECDWIVFLFHAADSAARLGGPVRHSPRARQPGAACAENAHERDLTFAWLTRAARRSRGKLDAHTLSRGLVAGAAVGMAESAGTMREASAGVRAPSALLQGFLGVDADQGPPPGIRCDPSDRCISQ